MSAFEELGICPEIIRTIEEEGWLLPTPIQTEAIPLILGGGDVCAAAETGSGKTGAFGIPALQIVNEILRNKTVINKESVASKVLTRKVCLNDNDKDMYVLLSEDGLECKGMADKKWIGAKGNIGLLRGKYIYEVELLSNCLMRVGWSSSLSPYEVGKDDKSFGYGGTAKKSWNSKFDDYGEPFNINDTIGCAIDLDEKTVSFFKNGLNLGVAFHLSNSLSNVPLKPAICGKNFHARCRFVNLLYNPGCYVPLGCADINHCSDIYNMNMNNSTKNNKKKGIICLILEPTRDLANQTYECLRLFTKYLDICPPRVGLLVGGFDDRAHKPALKEMDICVGTLHKVMDFIRKGEIDLSSLRLFILDEADEIIKNDDKNDTLRLKKMAEELQGGTRIQTLFFSATLSSKEVRLSIERLTQNSTWVDLKGRFTIPETVHLVVYKFDPSKTLPFLSVNANISVPTDGVHSSNTQHYSENEYLSRNIKMYKPQIVAKLADALDMKSCLIFCRTNLDCDNLESYFTSLGGGKKFSGKAESGKENPYSCVVLAGMRSQQERKTNLELFKQGDVRFLICTDVAARGIDISELPFLIMLNIPDEFEQFFHRVGRVGRAERMGLAISIISERKEKVWYHKCSNRGKGCTNTKLVEDGGCTIWYDDKYYLNVIEEYIGNPIPVMHPSNFSVEGILDSLGVMSKHSEEKDDRRMRRVCDKKNPENSIEKQSGMLLMYGKMKDNKSSAENDKLLQKLLPTVEELRELEKSVQQKYLKCMHNVNVF